MASSSIKRQRKHKRIDQDGDPEFQVAPMVDVLLVLMLFFMAITSTEVLKKNPNLVLPDAAHGKKPDPRLVKNQITVNIGWEKSAKAALYSMNGQSYPTADSMSGAITSLRAANPQATVLIRADADVEYSNIADMMNACAAAGVGTVTFSVIAKVGKAAKTAEAAADAGAGK